MTLNQSGSALQTPADSTSEHRSNGAGSEVKHDRRWTLLRRSIR
jgi:hypothetical protein